MFDFWNILPAAHQVERDELCVCARLCVGVHFVCLCARVQAHVREAAAMPTRWGMVAAQAAIFFFLSSIKFGLLSASSFTENACWLKLCWKNIDKNHIFIGNSFLLFMCYRRQRTAVWLCVSVEII